MRKKVNMLLIVFVLGLWGTLGYRSVKLFFYEPEQLVDTSVIVASTQFKKLEKDTFELQQLARDPFLGTYSKQKSERTYLGNSVKIQNKVSKLKTVAKKPFPSVLYFGYIEKNGVDQKELVLLKVNGKFLRLRINQSFEGLKIKKVSKDYIELSFNDTIQNIKKSKA